MALAFAPHVAQVVATDITPEMLAEAAKLAAQQGLANVETATADAEALPFADASFDLVSCRIAPHHFANVPRFVAEAARVLKPGGTFALVDNIAPDADTTPGHSRGRARRRRCRLQPVREDPRSLPRPRADRARLARAAGRHRGCAIAHQEIMEKTMPFRPWVKQQTRAGRQDRRARRHVAHARARASRRS